MCEVGKEVLGRYSVHVGQGGTETGDGRARDVEVEAVVLEFGELGGDDLFLLRGKRGGVNGPYGGAGGVVRTATCVGDAVFAVQHTPQPAGRHESHCSTEAPLSHVVGTVMECAVCRRFRIIGQVETP